MSVSQSFLEALYGTDRLPGYLTMWNPETKETEYLTTAAGAAAVAMSLAPKHNVYFGLGLRKDVPSTRTGAVDKYRRGESADVIAIPGVWCEIDHLGGVHTATNLPPDLETALAALREFPLRPTYLVHSGGGIHAYWLFRELWVFDDEAEHAQAAALVERFQATLREQIFRPRGWKLDSTKDLARVLRVPGSFNRKGKTPVPVRVLEVADARYNPSDFEPYLIDPTEARKTAVVAKPDGAGQAAASEPPADFAAIRDGCAWIRERVARAATDDEPDWYMALTVLARCGRDVAHEVSRPYPRYNPAETAAKIDHALTDSGPVTCAYVEANLGFAGCATCPFRGKITSPVELGRPHGKRLVEARHRCAKAKETVVGLAEKTKADPGAPFEAEMVTALAVLAEDEPAAWQRLRQELRTAGTNLRDLEAEVRRKRAELQAQAEPRKPSPAELGRQLLQQHRFIWIFETLHIYRDGCYRPDGESLVRKGVQDTLGELAREHDGDEAVYWLSNECQVRPEEVDSGQFINVQNGLLDPATGELHPHTPDYLSVVQLPTAWHPDAYHERADRFLDEVLPDKETRQVLEEVVGYILDPACRYEIATALVGPGANGKSTFLSWLTATLGTENVASVALQDLSHDRFRTAELAGKLANIYPELPNEAIRESDTFKALVSGDALTAERKFRNPFRFVNRAKLIFSTNAMPKSADKTEAFYRRWRIIPFPNAFPEGDPRRDPTLREQLSSPEARSYLLRLAVEGQRRARERGYIATSTRTQQAMAAYRRENDTVLAFIEDACERSGQERRDLLRLAYERWCHQNRFRPVSAVWFGRLLRQHVQGLDEARIGSGSRSWYYVGIRVADRDLLRPPDEETHTRNGQAHTTASLEDSGSGYADDAMPAEEADVYAAGPVDDEAPF